MKNGYVGEEKSEYFKEREGLVTLVEDYLANQQTTTLYSIKSLFQSVQPSVNFIKDILQTLDNKTISKRQFIELEELISVLSSLLNRNLESTIDLKYNSVSVEEHTLAKLTMLIKQNKEEEENHFEFKMKCKINFEDK